MQRELPQFIKKKLWRNKHELIWFTPKPWKSYKYWILGGLPTSGPRYGTAGHVRFPGNTELKPPRGRRHLS